MKIILSRKGFDSGFGALPSPILPDGKLISLPIPETDPNTYDISPTYDDLKFDKKMSYYNLIKQLKPHLKISLKYNGRIIKEKLTEDTKCHLDPDIRKGLIKQHKNTKWRPLFGQVDTAQSHLVNQQVGDGDLFLFFGWFKQTNKDHDKKIKYKNEKNYPEGKHVIFGYFQIGERQNGRRLLDKKEMYDNLDEWMKYHPHNCFDGYEKYKKKQTNTIYIASNDIGAGIFDYHEDLVLTKKGCSRSKWDLFKLFQDYLTEEEVKKLEISWNPHPWKIKNRKLYFKSSDRGQEFVIEENDKIEEWAKNLIRKHKS